MLAPDIPVDKGDLKCSLVGWAVKLAGCLSKQQLSNQAPTKAATAKNEQLDFQNQKSKNQHWSTLSKY